MPQARSKLEFPPRKHLCILQQQTGSALLEFSLCVGLVLFVVSAIIDYGITLRHKQIMADITKGAARAASAYRADFPPNDPRAGCGTGGSPSGIAQVALAWTQNYLTSIPADSASYTTPQVSFSQTPMTVGADSTPVNFIHVRVTRSGRNSCALCLSRFLPLVPDITVESIFRINKGPLCNGSI